MSSGNYYLRARYYNPTIGRFLTEDPYWNTSNMIYGSNPVKWNERQGNKNDPLGLNTYTFKPDIHAIIQSGNIYVYCMNNPLKWFDPTGLNAQNIMFVYDREGRDFIRQAEVFAENVYRNQNVRMIYITTADDFTREWNNLSGDIGNIHFFLHGWEGYLGFHQSSLSVDDIGLLNKISIGGSVGLWSCNGGTGGTQSVAYAISDRVHGRPVVAVADGNVFFRAWYQLSIGAPLTKGSNSCWVVFENSDSLNSSQSSHGGRRAPVNLFYPTRSR